MIDCIYLMTSVVMLLIFEVIRPRRGEAGGAE